MISKVSKKYNSRPSFTEEQYKLLLKTTRKVIDDEVN